MLTHTNEQFKQLYNELNISNVERLKELYADDIIFIDPFQ